MRPATSATLAFVLLVGTFAGCGGGGGETAPPAAEAAVGAPPAAATPEMRAAAATATAVGTTNACNAIRPFYWEDDPAVGDGAFSSAGSFGFYPWIDRAKTGYGVIARVGAAGSGYASARCGQLIRKAWATGVAQ